MDKKNLGIIIAAVFIMIIVAGCVLDGRRQDPEKRSRWNRSSSLPTATQS